MFFLRVVEVLDTVDHPVLEFVLFLLHKFFEEIGHALLRFLFLLQYELVKFGKFGHRQIVDIAELF